MLPQIKKLRTLNLKLELPSFLIKQCSQIFQYVQEALNPYVWTSGLLS